MFLLRHEIVGYNVEDLKKHLESLWKPGMTWDNYGLEHIKGERCWQIDHVRPVASFEFNSYDDPEFKKCWALENLQPLWSDENRVKSSYYKGKLYLINKNNKEEA